MTNQQIIESIQNLTREEYVIMMDGWATKGEREQWFEMQKSMILEGSDEFWQSLKDGWISDVNNGEDIDMWIKSFEFIGKRESYANQWRSLGKEFTLALKDYLKRNKKVGGYLEDPVLTEIIDRIRYQQPALFDSLEKYFKDQGLKFWDRTELQVVNDMGMIMMNTFANLFSAMEESM